MPQLNRVYLFNLSEGKKIDKEMDSKKKKVMVAIEETESSYYALVWVLNNLKESIAANKWSLILFSAPPLSNLTVLAPPVGLARLYFHGAAPYLHGSECDILSRKVSLGLLEKAKSICSSHGINAETVIGSGGDPKVAICSAVEEHSVDLLIVGDEDYGTLKNWFLMAIGGTTVSDYCSNNAKCPVLVVKKPAAEANSV